MTLYDCLDEFLLNKKLAGLVPGTVKNYETTLNLMINAVGNLEVCDLTYDCIAKYILDLYESDLSRATVASYMRNIRIFLRFIDCEHSLCFDVKKIQVPKSPKKNVKIYNDDEIKLIFSLVSTSIPWLTIRNCAIIALMLDSGLRQCEVCRLRWDDIDVKRMTIKITGKGSKDRMVSVGNFTLGLLENYKNSCPYFFNGWVFFDRRGNVLSGNAVRLFIYRLEKKLPFSLSSHKLRHNFATNYCVDSIRLTGKSDVYNLAILMGHESIETTKKYEHFAHELIAAENKMSHLDLKFENLK